MLPEFNVTFLVVLSTGETLSPINTVSSENTSSIGKPDMSLTENKEPDKLSVTENNSPCVPNTLNNGNAEPEPITINPCVLELDTYIFDADITFLTVIEPVTFKLPVTGCASVNKFPNLTPVLATCNSTFPAVGATFKEPVINVFPLTISVVPSKVKLASAFAVFAVPNDVNTLLSTAFVIVLNPVPDVPLVPALPLVPEEPALPDVPELPDEPPVPALPDEPLVPFIPLVPDVPLVPIPLVPDVPSVPDVPLVPIPLVPDVPLKPSVPFIPDVPELPEVPEVPDGKDDKINKTS